MGGAIAKNYDKRDSNRGPHGTPSGKGGNLSRRAVAADSPRHLEAKGNILTPTSGGASAVSLGGNETFVRKVPVAPKPLPQPQSSCLLPSKFLPQAPAGKDDVDASSSDIVASPKSGGGKLADSLSGKRLASVDGESPRCKGGPRSTANGGWLPFDQTTEAAGMFGHTGVSDGQVYSLDFPGMRSVPWFNGSQKRGSIKRRERPASIIWNEEEEIAISESSEPEQAGPDVSPAVASSCTDGEVGPGPHTLEERPETAQPEKKVERERRRPIVSPKVPHRRQLAKKALEDNALFASSGFARF